MAMPANVAIQITCRPSAAQPGLRIALESPGVCPIEVLEVLEGFGIALFI
jgi:hypothetical protein